MRKVLIVLTILISACAVNAPLCYAENEQKSFGAWRNWISDKQEYLGYVEQAMKDSRDMAVFQNADLDKAIRSGDKPAGEKVIAETSKKLSGIVDDLKAMTPPDEFKDYHKMVIDAYQFRRMANEATLKKDLISIKDYSRKAVICEVAAMENIRTLYLKHDAPPEIIDSIERGIAWYRREIIGL